MLMRTSSLFLTIVVVAALSCTAQTQSPQPYTPRPGDLLFQDLASGQGLAVKLATGSDYTHCAVLFEVNDSMLVYEAVGPVRFIPLSDWIAQGVNQHFVAMRLDDSIMTLKDATLELMRQEAETHLGKAYDLVFNWSDEKLYCSELVWKAYERGAGIELIAPRELGNYDLSHPAVREKLTERYGDSIPLTEPMVAPSDLMVSPKLTTVFVSAASLD